MRVPDVAAVPVWVWVVVGVGVLAAGIGGYFVVRYAVRRVGRRYIVGMFARQENVEAARKALESVLQHLADADDEVLLAFAQDAQSEDRRTFHEVEQRMLMLRDELDHMRIPAAVVAVAEQIADAAHAISLEAGRIRDDMSPEAVLDALGTVDLETAARELAAMRAVLDSTCREYDIEEAAVYGGGLYI